MKRLFLAFFFCCLFLAAFAAEVAQFAPVDGGEFRVARGGKLTRIAAFSPVESGTVELETVYSAETYTNALEILVATNTAYTVVESNAVTHVVTTNVFTTLSFETDPGIVGVATNVTVTAVTNAWPVSSGTVAVTNVLTSGTCSGHVLDEALDAPAYLAPGERIRFSGTATGGFLRLVFE